MPGRHGLKRALWLGCMIVLALGISVLPGIQVQAQRVAGGPPGSSANWHMIFDDEFNGTSLDATNWHDCFTKSDITSSGACKTANGFGALEEDTSSAITEHDGDLWIEAQHQAVTTSDGEVRQYTSGLLSTSGLFSFTYGYMELRFRIPAGKGLWPGFYTVFADPNSNTYPEIDVMEIRGQYPNVLWMTNHFVDQFGYDESDSNTFETTDYSSGFHTIGVDWEPDSMTWYVDGVVRKVISNPSEIPNMPMILRLSLEVGGDWNGPPDANTPFPSSLAVDYVHVWQAGPAATPTPAPTQIAVVAPPTAVVTNNGHPPAKPADPSYTWIVAVIGIALVALLAVFEVLRRQRLAMRVSVASDQPKPPSVGETMPRLPRMNRPFGASSNLPGGNKGDDSSA